MIQPLISEAEWMKLLSEIAAWNPSAKSMLVIAPHPDDETLGAGGLIAFQAARGIPITVAAVTDGEHAYPDATGLAKLRRREQNQALSRLGVQRKNIVRFSLPDGRVSERELVERLAPLVDENTQIIAPWKGDFHPDHQACGRAAEEVARSAGATLTSYFFWTWHFGTAELLEGVNLSRFRLDAGLLQAKTDALACHRSQLVREHGDPILPPRLLFPAKRPFEIFVTA